MLRYLKFSGAAVLALTLAACTNNSVDPNAFYGDLSAADKDIYMTKLVAVANAAEQSSSNAVTTVTTGDSETGILTSTGTYPKVVGPEQLEKARASIKKIKDKETICFSESIIVFTRHGIGYQAVLKDPNGTVLYESELCEGATFAPRPYNEQTSEQQSISLQKIALGFEARAASKNTDPKSNYKISFVGDAAQDAIFGTHAFQKPLSQKDITGIKAKFGNLNNDPEACKGGDIGKLVKYGLRFEYRIVDNRGKDIVTPLVCGSKTNSADVSTPKLRGLNASR